MCTSSLQCSGPVPAAGVPALAGRQRPPGRGAVRHPAHPHRQHPARWCLIRGLYTPMSLMPELANNLHALTGLLGGGLYLSARAALPWAGAGSKASTADAERELMELWSAVEKDKEAARERALAARRAQFARLRHQVHLWVHRSLSPPVQSMSGATSSPLGRTRSSSGLSKSAPGHPMLHIMVTLPKLTICSCRASNGSQDTASSSSRASAPSNLRLPEAAIHGSQASTRLMPHRACSSPTFTASAQPALRSAGCTSRRHCNMHIQNPSGSHLWVQTIPTARRSQQQPMCRRASTRHGCHRSSISTMHWLPATA